MANPTDLPKLLGIANLMVRGKLLEQAKALEIQNQAQINKIPFVHYLIQNNVLNSLEIARFISGYFGLSMFDISSMPKESFLLNTLNELLIRKHRVLPLFQRANQLFLGVDDPSRDAAIKEVQFYTRLQINLIVVESDKLNVILDEYLKQFETSDDSFSISSSESELAKLEVIEGELDQDSTTDVLGGHDAPIVRFINKILTEAMARRASDIHFEPYETIYRIRYRVDGILLEFAMPPISLAIRLSARLKILANLDIAERRLPQDGRFKVKNAKGQVVECRVSTCPVSFGEKIVIRLLDPEATTFDINQLGLDKTQKEIFLKTIHRPLGLILVTGPTGSGKSLTLYNALSILNQKEVNICTVEHPVEVRLTGINQVNVNPKAGLTFALALRSFLRQDPDIIMIGEIRDLETAEIAVAAAQTGHLVLATLHANSAIETITRLKNMGIPNYNIAGSLALMMAQRLVRRLCPHCRVERTDVSVASLVELGYTEEEASTVKLYAPKGCYQCTNGYSGRIGLYELLTVDRAIEDLISTGASSGEIAKYAAAHHMTTIFRSGLDKVKEGMTTLEEINRVVIE